MSVFILTLATTLLITAGLWFALGSRLSLSDEEQQNDMLNFLAYSLGVMPVSFVLIFFGVGG